MPATTLDRLLEHVANVDVLKLDLEGGELAALRGAEAVLARTEVVVTEVNVDVDAIVALLQESGFEVTRLRFTSHVRAIRCGH